VRDAASRHPRESADSESDSDEIGFLSSLKQSLLRNPRDSFAGLIAGAAISAILVNGLLLQPGPHPAPIFTIRPSPLASSEATGAIVATLPRPRPVEGEVIAPLSSSISRNRPELVSEIQKELIRRGFYDGADDGIYGAKTDAAIRDFEHAANLRPSLEPSEALLQSIARSSVKASPTLLRNSGQKNGSIAGLLDTSRQLVAIQRALSDYGYGPLKATGSYDADTRAAVERFERDRKMPISGQISERLTRELVAMTGRPLE
jgi:peptidoglycan hydrolase-like protein with peptidoglycan-binding domain